MKRHVILLVAAATSLVASTSSAENPHHRVDSHTQARTLASQAAIATYKRGPATPAVKELPSNDRRGNEVKVGDSTYRWRGSPKRGYITVATKLPNDGYEKIEQKRGVFRNYVKLDRKTIELDQGKRIETTTSIDNRRTFWRRRVENLEKTEIKTSQSGERSTKVETAVLDNKDGRRVEAQAVVTEVGKIPHSGHDVGAHAVISGAQGKDPKPTVSDYKPYGLAAQLRAQRQPEKLVPDLL